MALEHLFCAGGHSKSQDKQERYRDGTDSGGDGVDDDVPARVELVGPQDDYCAHDCEQE